MNIAEKIYQHSLKLPKEAAREALDFIEFLEQRYGQKDSEIDNNLQQRQAALAHIESVKVHWEDKPILDRDALYDESRG